MGGTLSQAQKNEGRHAYAHHSAHATLNIGSEALLQYPDRAGRSQLLALPLKVNASNITRTHAAAVALAQINQAGR